MKQPLLGLLSILILLAGCSKEPDVANDQDKVLDAQKRLVQSSNAFGINLLQQMNTTESGEENIFISPLSISMALGMTANGAEGPTKDAMLQVLEMGGLSLSDANQTYRDMLDQLPNLDPAVQLSIANAIWYRSGFPVKSTFTQVNDLYFDAQLQALNFDDPAAVGVMNNWVDNATNGTIPTIIDAINPDHVMFLMNAIYFKADWTEAFDPQNTAQWPFYRADGSTTNADMMMSSGMSYGYFSDNEVQVADIPYGNGQFSMTILLPAETTPVDQFLANLTTTKWQNWVNSLNDNQAPDLYLPKMELEYKSELQEVLTQLGMGVAFAPGEANFSNIADGHDLFITNVTHKTFLKVDEEGTTASGATSIGIGTTSAPPAMLINRPFILMIRARETDGIMFIGKIGNPAATY